MRELLRIALAIAIIGFLVMPNAHAYIDPATGTMILQALAAGLVAILVFGKRIYWQVSGWFGKKPKTDKSDDISISGGSDDA